MLDRYLLLKILEHSSKAMSKFAPEEINNSMVLENLSNSEFRIKLPIKGILNIFLSIKIFLFKSFTALR